ncbi:hypothetical protein Y1Q_0016107 [Alligator mississippiensis]|uniref:Uncharacterized protein n=1 Tax=Alligator mississippiensis TaxID=8496 RepID=A0A151N510_ALLMI|nr:hypothetical protein Y1Q_0016107 [Alligator mississippiensis]
MALLLKGKTQHISNSHLTKYEKLLLSAANVTLNCCSILNPASFLQIASEADKSPLVTSADKSGPSSKSGPKKGKG